MFVSLSRLSLVSLSSLSRLSLVSLSRLSHLVSLSPRLSLKARLLLWAEKLHVEEGTTLCGADDDGLYLLYLGEMHLKTKAAGGDGAGPETSSLSAGSFFNADRVLLSMGSLSGAPSTVGAVAATDSVVLRIAVPRVLALMKVRARARCLVVWRGPRSRRRQTERDGEDGEDGDDGDGVAHPEGLPPPRPPLPPPSSSASS